MNIALKTAALIGVAPATLINVNAAAQDRLDTMTSDEELIVLSQQLQAAFTRHEKAGALNSKTFAEFERICPDRPTSLLWQSGDPVRAASPEQLNGKACTWCNFLDIEELGENTHRYAVRYANPKTAARAAELIEVYNSYTAAREVAREVSGHSAAEQAFRQSMADMDDIYEQMLSHIPKTFEGMKAIATAILLCPWFNQIEGADGDQADRGIASLVAAMTGTPLPTAL